MAQKWYTLARKGRCNMARKGEKWSEQERAAHSGNPQGWVDSRDGYLRIKAAGKTVLYHRYIMEQHLGRKLTRKEAVHHVNGDRSDNRLENLQVLPLGQHTATHHEGSKHTAEARAKMSAKRKLRVTKDETRRKVSESLREYNRRKREGVTG